MAGATSPKQQPLTQLTAGWAETSFVRFLGRLCSVDNQVILHKEPKPPETLRVQK